MEKVVVVISTYNGEQYISRQMESLINQTYKNMEILIRDDGSTDSTIEILKEYSGKYMNVSYYAGDNIGVVESFYDLLKNIPDDTKYISTCDQDDVWMPDKLETAIQCLKDIDGPALYCGRTQLTDENLQPIEDGLRTAVPRISFGNAMIENVCIGCTMVFNRDLYNIVSVRWPKQSLMHDWWIYQAAVCFGKVIYDETPHIYYRQHGNNEIGMDKNRWSLIKRQVRSLKRFRGKYTEQMREFTNVFSLSGENEELADLMVGTSNSIRCRWKVLFDRRIYRQGHFDTVLFKGMLFFGML